eukprot:2430134-Amphidinium_carterae.1
MAKGKRLSCKELPGGNPGEGKKNSGSEARTAPETRETNYAFTKCRGPSLRPTDRGSGGKPGTTSALPTDGSCQCCSQKMVFVNAAAKEAVSQGGPSAWRHLMCAST